MRACRVHERLRAQVPLYERIALYSVADVAVVTATRDGMNLVPYEYIVCRQGMKARLRIRFQGLDQQILNLVLFAHIVCRQGMKVRLSV